MRVRWTIDAANDLEQIARYVQRDNPLAARELVHKITSGIASLGEFPNRGRTGRVDGTREMVFPSLPYIAVYRLKDDLVQVLRVYHAAQDWP